MAEMKVKVEGMWSENQGYTDLTVSAVVKEPTPVVVKKVKVRRSSKTNEPGIPVRRSSRNKKNVKETVNAVEEELPEVVMTEEDEPEAMEMMLN